MGHIIAPNKWGTLQGGYSKWTAGCLEILWATFVINNAECNLKAAQIIMIGKNSDLVRAEEQREIQLKDYYEDIDVRMEL